MERCGVRLKEGRLPEPRTNELVLSEEIARALDLELGDQIDRSLDGTYYEDVLEPLVLVGVLEGDPAASSGPSVRVGFVSYEYLANHELTSSRSVHLLIVPADGRKRELDAWLEGRLASAQTNVTTYAVEYREHRQFVQGLTLGFAVVGCITAIVAAIAMATLNYVFFTQRREEFGILHAVGRSRLWLVLRTMKETGSVIAVAWLIGAVICCVGLICFQVLVFAPKGLRLNFFNPAPWVLTFPIPLAVIAAGVGTTTWMLSNLDTVSIIERRV
jgi:predicted lysophospholipase L1 biosynthesis ABC-type transport system permease subunit